MILDNDILCRRGKGGHPGNSNLRGKTKAMFVEYEAGNKQTKKKIADDLVLEVQVNGGRFMGWDEDNPRYFEMSNRDAVKVVKTGFDRFKHKLSKGRAKQQLAQKTSSAIKDVGSGEAPCKKKPSNGNEIATLEPIDEVMVDSLGSLSDNLYRELLQDLYGPFEDELAVQNKPLRDEGDDSARGRLLALLSDEGSEQLAEAVLSIVNSSAGPDIATSATRSSISLTLDYQAQTTLKKAKKSLQQPQWRQSKRPRRNAPGITKEDGGSQPDDALGKVGALKDDLSKSIYSSQLVRPLTTERVMAKIKIEKQLRVGNKNDREYTGSTLEGKPHGSGFMIFKNGKILCGNWLHGVFEGQGCALYENGDTCFGSFLENKVHGYATYKTTFTKYVGQYHMNKRHGKGVLNDMEMGIYNGDFVDGKFEGLGVHTPISGNIQKFRKLENQEGQWQC
ncbi:unnamed protein product [Cylindrotheca closterium]|uniref:DUF6824 domain-containing protein n=1 Tax=Cylindrotheca closterium TaxID=2856 RepID=A0AAD2CV21_9STRA|nr:unnamed protein product [Cylindrotheca closterium]